MKDGMQAYKRLMILIMVVVYGCGGGTNSQSDVDLSAEDVDTGGGDGGPSLDSTVGDDQGNQDADELDFESSQAALDEFFSLAKVHSIAITVDQAGYDALLKQPKEYVKGTVTIDGTEYKDVGVRLRGVGSFIPLDKDYASMGDNNGMPGSQPSSSTSTAMSKSRTI